MGSGGSKQKGKPGSNSGSEKRKQLLKTLSGHTGGINCMDISVSGSYLLTGSDDRTARVWDLVTYENKVVLEGHSGYISCCKIWQDRFALTGSVDKTIRKWNIFSGNCVLKMEMHRGIINSLLPYGIYLFSASYDRTVICWNIDTGQAARVLRGHKQSILPMLYVKTAEHNPMGAEDIERNKDALITGSMDCTAKIWSIHSGTSLRTFRGHKGAILCLTMDRDKKYLYTGSTDFSIKKWNLASSTLLKSFKGHEGSVICLEINHKLLYSASVDSTARCWVAEFGDTTRKYSGHEHMISDMKYHKGLLITSSGDNTVRVFDAKSGSLKRTFKGHKYAVNCIMAVDSMIFSASYDGTVRLWNIRDLIREKLSAIDESCSSLASSDPSLAAEVTPGSNVSIENGRASYDTKQASGHAHETIPLSTFKMEREESRVSTANGNRTKRKGGKTSNKIVPMGTRNHNNNNANNNIYSSNINLTNGDEAVDDVMNDDVTDSTKTQTPRSSTTETYHDAADVWQDTVSVKSGSNRSGSDSSRGKISPKVTPRLSRNSTKASLFSTPDDDARSPSHIKESDIQLHSASTFRTNSMSISLPSTSNSSRTPITKIAHNRESSDVSRKRVKTDESQLRKEESINDGSPSRMSSADLALVDEEMKMIAVETDSTSTGYHSDKSSPQSPNENDKKQQLPLTGKRTVPKSKLRNIAPSPIAERSSPRRSTAGRPSLWAPCSNSTENTSNFKTRKLPKNGQRRTASIRSTKTPLTPKERERLENEILEMT